LSKAGPTAKARRRAPGRRRLTAPARREVIEQAALAVFSERGYHGASMDEIARRSGVTPPVVYDHFASKVALHKRLLERTRDELVAMWAQHFPGDAPLEQRVPRAIEAWARYVEAHPYAPRMFFTETTGLPEVQAIHREVQAQARAVFGAMLGEERVARLAGADPESLEMAAEVMRSGLTGLAIWWSEHPAVPRERIVETALAVVGGFFSAEARPAAPRAAGSSRSR
jgi:AcrR family transcriptional regulator